MTRVVARLILSFMLVPLILFGMIVPGVALTNVWHFDEELVLTVAFAVGSLLYPAGYWFLWRKLVAWTPRRVSATAAVTAVAVAGGIAAHLVGQATYRRYGPPLGPLSHVLLSFVWVVVCTWLWMESPRERLARMAKWASLTDAAKKCPACKYDMSGLKNLTCPECGLAMTVGEFVHEHQLAAHPPVADA